jgi:hypothetical protein
MRARRWALSPGQALQDTVWEGVSLSKAMGTTDELAPQCAGYRQVLCSVAGVAS